MLGLPGGPAEATDDDLMGRTVYTGGPYFPSDCAAVQRSGPGGGMADGIAFPTIFQRPGPGGALADGQVVAEAVGVTGPGGGMADGIVVPFASLLPLVATGGLRLDGAADLAHPYLLLPAGGLRLDGSADMLPADGFLTTGGLRLDGGAGFLTAGELAATGGVRLDGSATMLIATTLSATGGVRLDGGAEFMRTTPFLADGGVRVGGSGAGIGSGLVVVHAPDSTDDPGVLADAIELRAPTVGPDLTDPSIAVLRSEWHFGPIPSPTAGAAVGGTGY